MDLGASFNPGYFSLQDILSSHIRVPCTTLVELPRFGFLDPSLHSEDLPKHVRIELPLWAARLMSSRKYVSVEIPKNYQESFRDALKAEPAVVDLNKMGPHFYQSGLHLSTLHHREAEEIGEMLPKVLQNRLQNMADSFSYSTTLKNADEESAPKSGSIWKESHMDSLEHKIFDDAKNSYKSLVSWLEKR